MKLNLAERKNAKVFFRVFPMEKMKWEHVKILEDHKTVYIRYLQELAKSKEKDVVQPTYWNFHTDYVFYNDDQKEIHDKVTSGVLEKVMQGRDAIIMAYGQTGTGKSLSVNGLHYSFENRGLLPRIISDLFEMKSSLKKNMKMCVQISYIEISRVTIRDLLKPFPNTLSSLKEIARIKVKTEDEALKFAFIGEGRKQFSENSSYLSHSSSSIFTFYISLKNIDLNDPHVSVTRLHVIDLAGADTVGNFSCLFKYPQEIGSGNLTKTQLEQFILILSESVPDHIKVKQRLNPMIQYLGDSLSTSNILRFIGHIRITQENLLVTISMLRFGQLVSGLKPSKYEANQQEDVNKDNVLDLQKKLEELKSENADNSVVTDEDLSMNIDKDRFSHIQRTVNEYLQDKITDRAMFNVADTKLVIKALKRSYKECEEDKNKAYIQVSTLKSKRVSSSSIKKESKQSFRKSSHISTEKSSSETKNEKSHTSVAQSPKSSKAKLGTSQEGIIKTKQSSASLLKRSSTGKRKSSSSASVFNDKKDRIRSRSEIILLPEMAPEYTEAWNCYVTDQYDDYRNFKDDYEKNESVARTSYKTYTEELNKLQQFMLEVEKTKNDLLMAEMTRKYQQIEEVNENGDIVLGEIEQICLENLKKAESRKVELQESVLKCQADLKISLKICNDIKKDLKSHFEEYCKEKFQMLVEILESDATSVEVVEKIFVSEDNDEEIKIKEEVVEEKEKFEKMQRLMMDERKKIDAYKRKNKKWIKLFK